MDIDPVLLSEDEGSIFEFASDIDKCVVVDHREDERNLIESVISVIPEAGLAYEEDESGEDLILSYKDRSEPVGLTMSPQDRYITIRAINDILAGDYEMRLFGVTYESDTHSFYLKPASWWREAEQTYPTEIGQVFRKVDENLDFP